VLPAQDHRPAARHCATHDLACGPDGLCVLCRRAQAPPAAASNFAGRVIIGGAVTLGVLAVGAIGVKTGAAVLSAAKQRAAAKAAVDAEGAPAETVRLFSTAWCPTCVKAKKWLNAQNIPFAECDVERDPWARREFRKLNPRGTVPVFDVAGEVVIGFNEDTYRTALQKVTPRAP
jgi:glutaredoxin